jgi:3-oxoacyl-[acyl-carrier protein] reductase
MAASRGPGRQRRRPIVGDDGRMNELDFSGKTVLVVGGSSGIGNGVAHGFGERGAHVHVWGTRASAADYEGVEGSNLAGLAYAGVDVADRDAVEACQPAFDRLDVLVLCQGTVVYGRGEFEPEGWDRVMAVNLDSLMACARRFKPMLAEARGSLIIVSSISGFRASRGNPAYAASKAGAISLIRSLGEAWAPDGVRVNGIAPGLVDTKLTKATTANPKRLAGSLAAIPLGRLGKPCEIGGAALFLASPLASYVVGQTITVDGGMTLS